MTQADFAPPTPENVARVLVLYSGGTIGMLSTPEGYLPEKGYLTQYLKSQGRFHDPQGLSLFSNSQSAETYRKWTASGSCQVSPTHSRPVSPLPASVNRQCDTSIALTLHPSSAPTFPPSPPHSAPAICCGSQDCNLADHLPSNTLITPPIGKDGRRIQYTILEYETLIDSVNINFADWIKLASDIEANYDQYDGFVILHGTDTMAYTSSALSFLLENLTKTVIVTGAQVPLGQLRNDAVDNVLGSLVLAGCYTIPEVCLYFDHKLIRGNRARKVSTTDFEAFLSPNLVPLAKLGVNIDINENRILSSPPAGAKFRAHKVLDEGVAILEIFPGITTLALSAILSPPFRGVVLKTFGSGNFPQREDLMAVIKKACDRGMVIVNITQCAKGSVLPFYPSQIKLNEAGVRSGYDMTPECALTKLSYLLSKCPPNPADPVAAMADDWNPVEAYLQPCLTLSEVRLLMGIDLRGELTAIAKIQN